MPPTIVNKPYKGTISKRNMRNNKLYQGTINSKNLKPSKPYQGTLNRDKFKPDPLGDFPNHTKYYSLPPDYYGIRKRRTKVPPISPAQHRQKQIPEKVDHPEVNQITDHNQNNYVPLHKKDVNNKPPTTAPKSKRKQNNKPQAQVQAAPAPISPFPAPSPEVLPPVHNGKLKINPDVIKLQRDSDPSRPEPIFPPIIPVTLEDYIKQEPPIYQEPERPRRNPLIPVMVPGLDTNRSHLVNYNNSSASSIMPMDIYNDTISPSYTSVPGYSAVGAMLRSMNI
uniref:Uncharacterized protein n=1 Tax=Arion vulgaris TaxID=1028688 RepID=A0A0B7BWZ8_9EUPU